MITIKNHPFPFLLRFEWGLLLLAAIGEFFRAPPLRLLTGLPRFPGLNLAIVLLMLVLGWQLQTVQAIQTVERSERKWFPIAAQILAMAGVMAIAMFGTGFQFFPLLCVVFVIRTGLMVTPLVHRWLTGATFAIAAGAQIYHTMMVQIPRWEQRVMRQAERFGDRPLRFRVPPEFRPDAFQDLRPDVQEFFLSRLWVTSISSVILLGLVLLFVQVLIGALVAERRSQMALVTANQQLRNYALRVEDLATMQERDRISREIHDSLGHSLTVFNLHLEAGLRLWERDPAEAKELFLEAKQQGSEALQAVRNSVADLRSDSLKQQTLPELIQTLIQDWQRSTGIQPDCQIDLPQPIPESVKIALYRILQESLTNIAKYAQATTVQIRVQQSKQQSKQQIQLQIMDNGIGFIRSQIQTGFGLQGMEERAMAIGGTVAIETEPGQGCCIRVTIPIA